MFKKDKRSSKIQKVEKVEKVTTMAMEPAPPVAKLPEATDSQQGNTVIANDVRFEGNINAAGMIYIHGKVFGNIESANGMIKIMRNGYVEGNILAKEVVIDGTVLGKCQADIIDIQENGKITGSIAYHTLAIKRGGEFSGQSEIRQSAASNVIGFVGDKTDFTEELKTEAFDEALS